MPVPRSYVDAIDNASGLGLGQPAIPGYGSLKQVKARDIACPGLDCLAEEGEDCTTGRMSTGKPPVPLMCPDRIALARLLRDRGELEVTVVEPLARCRLCSGVNGRFVACPEHRCERLRCVQAKETGSSFCTAHRTERRGNAKMTDAKIARMQQMRAKGITQKQIAAELGVSAATLSRYYKYLDY